MQLAKDDMMAESSLLRNNVIWNVEFQAGNILTIEAQVKFWILNNFRPNQCPDLSNLSKRFNSLTKLEGLANGILLPKLF